MRGVHEQSDPPRFVAASGNQAIIRAPATVTPFLAGQTLRGYRIRHSFDGATWTTLPGVLAPGDFPLTVDIGAPAAGLLAQARIVTERGEGPWSTNLPLNRGGRIRGIAVAVSSRVMPPELELEAAGLEGWWRADVPDHITLDAAGKVSAWSAIYGADLVGRPATQADPTLRPDYDAAAGLVVSPVSDPRLTRLLETPSGDEWSMLLVGEVAAPTGSIANRIGLFGNANNRAYVQTALQTGEPREGRAIGEVQANLNGSTSRVVTTENELVAGQRLHLMATRGSSRFRVRAIGPAADDADVTGMTISGAATMSTLVIGGRDPNASGLAFRIRHAVVWRRDIGITALADVAAALP